jgi:hypothetical protein
MLISSTAFCGVPAPRLPVVGVRSITLYVDWQTIISMPTGWQTVFRAYPEDHRTLPTTRGPTRGSSTARATGTAKPLRDSQRCWLLNIVAQLLSSGMPAPMLR